MPVPGRNPNGDNRSDVRKFSGAVHRRSISMRKPRAVTRANAKKGKEEDRLTIRSSYGYMDPTPYFALKNIEKTEKKKKKTA